MLKMLIEKCMDEKLGGNIGFFLLFYNKCEKYV